MECGFGLDVDHRAATYEEALGFKHGGEASYRIVQLTPPGSECSIQIGTGITRVTPGTYQGMYLISSDIEATRTELVDRAASPGPLSVNKVRSLAPRSERSCVAGRLRH